MSIVNRWAAAAALLFPALGGAQGTPSTVVITGNPLARDQTQQPSSVLAGDGLVLRRAGTLGDTLDGLPGVASSWFGPNAGRPVVRGLDGDRVRLLDNGGASVDASSLSFDHATAIDPLVVERIEVLRGPAALLYGGSATGGVVNTFDGRIPRATAAGLAGRAELRLGGATAERAGAAVLEGGQGGLAWHVDAFGRSSNDLRVPRFVPRRGDELLPPSERVRNSAARGDGGALGASWVGRQGFVGVAVDGFATRYGVTAEPDVTIDMKRRRVSLAGEWRPAGTLLDGVTLRASRTAYRHEEVEGSGEIGTRFDSRGSEWRLQARHRTWRGLSGVWGLQTERLDFTALGDEAFVPGTHTRAAALFVLEDWTAGAWTWSAGLRRDQVQVASDGDTTPGGAFGSAQRRRFQPLSGSLGATWRGGSGWLLTASLGRTERAPAYYELFANGVHLATAAYERGDASLPTERSRHAELGLASRGAGMQWKLQLFRTDFARYVGLAATGDRFERDDELLPVYAFRPTRARLQGFEAELRVPLQAAGWAIEWTGTLDAVRGTDLDRREPLPRLAPLRLRSAIEGSRGAWRWALQWQHAARQDRVPADDTATPGYWLFGAQLAWRTRLGAADALWFLRAQNLGNRLAYNAGTVATLRGLAPLPGRSLAAGLRVGF